MIKLAPGLNSPTNLEYISLLYFSSYLFKQSCIRITLNQLFSESTAHIRESEWPQIQQKLRRLIYTNFPVSFYFLHDVIKLLKVLAIEAKMYLITHKRFFGDLQFTSDTLKKICYKSYGILDKVETAKLFVKDESFDVGKRFDLACTYCLEEDITSLWKSMPEYKQNHYRFERSVDFYYDIPMTFWTCQLDENIEVLDNILPIHLRKEYSSYQFAFNYSSSRANEAAVQYYANKLSVKQREDCFVKAAINVARFRSSSDNTEVQFPSEFSKVLAYLFSKLSDEKKIEILESCAYGVLRCFLDWPWQEFFLEIAEYVWPYLLDIEYVKVLQEILNDRISAGCTDYDYRTLFMLFWEQTPRSLKQLIIQPCKIGRGLLIDLLRNEDHESIALILNDASVNERVTIAYHCTYWETLLCPRKIDFLKYFLRRCLSSNFAVDKCKKKILKKITILKRKKKHSEEYLWGMFLDLFDDLFCNESRPAKKVCK